MKYAIVVIYKNMSKKIMSKKNLVVSVIVPTYNSEKFLEECLQSISDQSYKNIEIIVVDNNSKDNTKKIAKKFTDKVFNKGPERSAQRNFGVKNSQGQYVAIIDSDMNLEKNVIAECIDKIYELDENKKCSGIIIPEKSFGKGFWAECKTLERSFYEGVDFMEAARFFFRSDYITLGGYDELLTSGEDWDLSQRMDKIGILKRINSYIFHNEGTLSLWRTVSKKFYYARKFASYTQKSSSKENLSQQINIIGRYKLFFSQPKKLFKNYFQGFGMIFMKTCEFGFGAVGYGVGKIFNKYFF